MRGVIAAVAAIGLTAGLAACSNSSNQTESSSDKIRVVASSNQWGSLAQELGGDYVDVTSILNNTSADAHDYEPTSADIKALQQAQVVIVNGAGYDEWAVKAAEQSKATIINAAQEGGKETGDNPHVWFSADVRIKTADAISAAYEKIEPDHSEEFKKLNATWTDDEKKLDEELAAVAKNDEKNGNYAAAESIAEYLADDMGLTDVTPQGYKQAAANESEPTPSDIKQFTDLLKEGDVNMLIMNSQEPSDMSNQLISAADSGNVPVVDITEQMPSQYKNMHEWIRAILQQIQSTESK